MVDVENSIRLITDYVDDILKDNNGESKITTVKFSFCDKHNRHETNEFKSALDKYFKANKIAYTVSDVKKGVICFELKISA